ncbi:MaoC family dehydratase N-terminal domain-containing protein [Salirhabdus sp. Marseille-P4669]|uniref:MaoC family dehydratase N-terminal domain-containing protein n=1 Tax=Salirhabdus sp. Marseille-P4669 TaxID=2042310 RepID=UPI000C7A65A9|nr:MaoC family dehydratase N-terminal domain-containing protein [Salirhabdus sp. Marseille-P4669]
MLNGFIGKKSNRIKNTVERGLVLRFAEAIQDNHPIYTNEKFGKESRYGKNIAPPTFPIVFDFGTIPDLKLPSIGLIHGEQHYHYERPLFVGEDVYCYSEVKDYYEKEGKNGLMGFLIIMRYGEDADQNILFTEKQVVIITEAVRREMLK